MLFLLFIIGVFSQNYCKRSDGIKITVLADCLSSAQYNVENCCFECLQINVVNQTSQIKCGSLYSLGFTSCSPESETAALAACGGGTYACLCNVGSDKSEVNAVTPSAPSSSSNIYTNLLLFIFGNLLIVFINK
jgi:hypothetical protein